MRYRVWRSDLTEERRPLLAWGFRINMNDYGEWTEVGTVVAGSLPLAYTEARKTFLIPVSARISVDIV